MPCLSGVTPVIMLACDGSVTDSSVVRAQNVKLPSAAVAYDPARTSSEAIAQAIADEGYAVVSTENAATRGTVQLIPTRVPAMRPSGMSLPTSQGYRWASR